ncbi:hypothetical protein [Streptomyces luteireticuli]|uniref:hypothetical protein n=1 Tax=Streptomyces luteireticuli TaxID=173858 RepID=UPI00355812FE
MRKAAQFTGAALIAAVLMTGCGSGSKDDGDAKKNDAASSGSSGSGQQSQAPAAGGDGAAALQGGWAKGSLLDKSLMVLAVAGDHASLSVAPKVACSGKVVTTARPVTFELKCLDGSTEYAKGTVKSVDAKSITVAWASGKEDTLKKDTEADKPAGLPKAGG